MTRSRLGALAGLAVLIGAANGPVNADDGRGALSFNALLTNALLSNALLTNSLSINAVTHNGVQVNARSSTATQAALSELNGVMVEAVTVSGDGISFDDGFRTGGSTTIGVSWTWNEGG